MELNYKKAIKQVIKFLEKIEKKFGIKYYLVGGILASLYSDIRATEDIDFVTDLASTRNELNFYVELLKDNGFFPFQDWKSAVMLCKENSLLQLLDRQQLIKLDNYIILTPLDIRNKYSILSYLGLKNRKRLNVGGIKCWVASKEDFILGKLLYGGWQDYHDALGCWLRFKNELNTIYLEKNSKKLGIHEKYELLKSGIRDPDDFF